MKKIDKVDFYTVYSNDEAINELMKTLNQVVAVVNELQAKLEKKGTNDKTD